MTRYVCVDDQKAAGFPVTAACEAAGVSTSGYYDWREREEAGPTERQLAEAELVALMRALFDEADGNYGVPRMFKALRHAGLIVNKKRVRRLMRLHGMAGRFRRRKCRTTFPGTDGYHIPDLVGRDFAPGRPDAAWCQDITYIPTREGWLYLASVLDLGSRRLLGYSMAGHMRTELVLDALGMAVAARGDDAVAGVIAHADRGSQYTSNDYVDFCQDRKMRPSAGQTGVCWDNAVAESFWESLKRECLQGRIFATRAEARRAIFRWINWYNTKRLHSTLNDVPPLEWEQQYRQAS
ncbi:MAG: IS3 family transposase [Pseudonocardiaceae bacterium]